MTPIAIQPDASHLPYIPNSNWLSVTWDGCRTNTSNTDNNPNNRIFTIFRLSSSDPVAVFIGGQNQVHGRRQIVQVKNTHIPQI